MAFDSSGFQAPELAYDLRQAYAKIVGDHMLDIAEARKADNYYNWYKSLENLHTVIRHKFRLDKDETEYCDIKLKVTTVANKNSLAWKGISNIPVERMEIENLLRKLEEFLYAKMSQAKMFGEGGKIAGL